MLRPVDARGNVGLGRHFYLDIQISTTAHAVEEKREALGGGAGIATTLEYG